MVDQMTLAFDLIELGFAVFPVNPDTKHPYTTHGHLDASRDVEEVAVWFSVDHPNAVVGVHAGASGLVILDLDKKNGKNGFESVDDGWLEIPDSYHYDTPSGGRHYIYRAPESKRLAPARDYRGLSGVDRRGGSSYAVWYGETPAADSIMPAPEWLCDEVEQRTGSAFDGELDDWLNNVPDGDPDGRVIQAIQRIPKGEFDHVEMVERQMELIRLAAEGHPGVRVALDALRREWLRPPYDSDDYAYEYDQALHGCVKKFGATDAAITELPEYSSTLANLPTDFPIGMLVGEAKPKKHLFDVMRLLCAIESFDDYQVAAILWGAPTVKQWAREWGLQYVYQQIAELRSKNNVTIENPTIIENVAKLQNISLLSDEEQQYLSGYCTFVDRYLHWVESKSKNVNRPYHRMNAVTILSLAYGMYGFIPESEGAMGLNVFQIGLGESSTGKTRSIKMRDAVLREFFKGDETYDLGSDASIQALNDVLLKRDGRPSFFNADEAAVTFSQMVEQKWLAGMESFLTRLYEGYVPPMLRRGSTDTAKPAMTSFNVAMYGTPDRVMDILTQDMFMTGFLPRFVWTIGDPPDDSDDQHRMSQASSKLARLDYDPVARGFATEFMLTRRMIGSGRHPVRATDEALERFALASKQMKEVLVKHPLWRIIEPSWKRLAAETTRKFASLIALSEGSTTVTLKHALYAIRQAEEWVNNLVTVSEGISASVFQRECDDVERFVVTNGGSVTKAKLVNRFRAMRFREFNERLESLYQQGRLREDASGTKVEVNI
jgi:hypothetical protein